MTYNLFWIVVFRVHILNDRGNHHQVVRIQKLCADSDDMLHGRHFLLDGFLLLLGQGQVLFQHLRHKFEERVLLLGGHPTKQTLYQRHH